MSGGMLLPDDEILVQFLTGPEHVLCDDFYFKEHEWVTLSSKDGGLTWAHKQVGWTWHAPRVLADGTWIDVKKEELLRTPQEEKTRLEDLGIGHVWNEKALFIYDLWPDRMRDELKATGQAVWDHQWCLPLGTVAMSSCKLVCLRSSDQGRTWTHRPIALRREFALLETSFNWGVVLPDQTILLPCYGKEKAGLYGDWGTWGAYILRSTDAGASWDLQPLALVPRGSSETCLIHLGGSRVLALMRFDKIRASVSEDGGLTWSPQIDTPMWGYPLHGIRLQDGTILCAYGYRRHPAGARACLSRDDGRTWDIADEKILRNDCLPTHWIGGPVSFQRSDGSIFTFYPLPRVEAAKRNDALDSDKPLRIHPPFHAYLAGSRYTPDYLRPLAPPGSSHPSQLVPSSTPRRSHAVAR